MGADLGDADMDAIVSLLVADSDGDDNAISYREFVQVGTVAKTVDSIGDTVQKKLVPHQKALVGPISKCGLEDLCTECTQMNFIGELM